MENIVTVTLNPSIDVTLWVNALDRDAVNRVERERREAGGKGINVSRELSVFGVNNRCLALAGRRNAKEFAAYLSEAGLVYDLLATDGAVRENLTLRYEEETVKINRQGVELSTLETAAIMQHISSRVGAEDIVVFAGSLPQNMTTQDYVELILTVGKSGAAVAIDSDLLTFEQYKCLKPWLIKPNIFELGSIVPLEDDSLGAIRSAAEKLVEAGVENVLVSMGSRGMMLVNADGAIMTNAPHIDVKSTVGAGDSALAGFLIGYTRGSSIEECVRLATACGSATAAKDGTALGDTEHINALLPEIKAQKL